MKQTFLATALVLFGIGCASSNPEAIKMRLVKQFDRDQVGGSAVACVTDIQDVSLARAVSGNRARAAFAYGQDGAEVSTTTENTGYGVVRTRTMSATLTGVGIDYQIEGFVVCARARKIEI